MKYLDKTDVITLNDDWSELFSVINDSILAMSSGDFSQPIKPYLRFKDKRNRIIAMPAYIGGDVDMAGIKWIASFPANIERGFARANSTTVLNNSETGAIECIINTAEISSIRTAAVTGTFIKKILEVKPFDGIIKIGVIGYGPVAKMHINMLKDLFAGKDYEINVCDINYKKDISDDSSLNFYESYEAFFEKSDIIITATNSSQPYIDKVPKKGSLHLNVSLRDYKDEFFKDVNKVFVDNWEEVCRENTDIERVHLSAGLEKENTIDLIDLFKSKDVLENISEMETLIFNPMGMAVFDIAVADYFYRKSVIRNKGKDL